MKVKDLISKLAHLNDPEALIDIASDEEGNAIGDISESLSLGTLKDGSGKGYTLWPENQKQIEDKYKS